VSGAGGAPNAPAALKLTAWFGERDGSGGRLLADVLLDACARHRIAASCLLRGHLGFGARHALQTGTLLTPSEDLPLALVAVDAPERVTALLEEVRGCVGGGLVTLKPLDLLGDAPLPDARAVKLTLHLGRRDRAGDRPAHVAAVDALRAAGAAGATVLLGVDGTARGVRERARFFDRNARVPLLVVSVGAPKRIAAALPRLRELLADRVATLEAVDVLKRDGAPAAAGVAAASSADRRAGVDAGVGGEPWQQLVVYASEQSRHGGESLHAALVRRLRAEGAAGATALRGVRGYHGDHAPHGDRFGALRRRVPIVTVVADTPERARRWRALVDELTDETGLVTSEPLLRVPSPAP
jgi:PII-like signaling protein